jgi:hypothetical protein
MDVRHGLREFATISTSAGGSWHSTRPLRWAVMLCAGYKQVFDTLRLNIRFRLHAPTHQACGREFGAVVADQHARQAVDAIEERLFGEMDCFGLKSSTAVNQPQPANAVVH